VNAPNPLRVWLVRHGVTEWNLEGRWQGWSDTPLSARGVEQAERLARRLAGRTFDAVYSSDLERASETARLAGFQPMLDARLREIHFGDFEGGLNADHVKHPEFAAWLEQPGTRRTPNGESYGDLQTRMLEWLGSLPESGEVLAFSHGGAIQTLVTGLLKIPALVAPRVWTLRVTHASITVLERWWTPSGAVWTLERLNDAAHLEGEAVLPLHVSV
jgi:broad specificity phosphatase PhoE